MPENTTEQTLTIVKCNHLGDKVWQYPARVLSRNAHKLVIEAFFNRSDLPFHGITLRENDRFVEAYFDNRWYNIYEIHDREDDHLKAWYCNITRPTRIELKEICYDDLALDLLAFPDGGYLVLDQAEFEALGLDEETRQTCWRALGELIAIHKGKTLSPLEIAG